MQYVGWDEVTTGVVLNSFRGEARDVHEVNPEDRDYAETNSYNKLVSDWRVLKPIYNKDYCIDCQFCWIYCPDTSIISRDQKMVGIDYNHCKGCGICAEVCPTNPKSLVMFSDFTEENDALAQWPQKEEKSKD